MDTIINIISLFVTGIFAYLIWLIINSAKSLPELLNNLVIKNTEHKNAKELQRESYYKDLSGNTLEILLNTWTEALIDLDKMKELADEAKFNQLKKDTLMYGSSDTVNDFNKYMKFNYLGNKSYDAELNDDEHMYLQLLLFAKVISDLKYDFTGHRINPRIILEIQIKDFSEKVTDEMDKKIQKIMESM